MLIAPAMNTVMWDHPPRSKTSRRWQAGALR
jgi:hypothetical protein